MIAACQLRWHEIFELQNFRSQTADGFSALHGGKEGSCQAARRMPVKVPDASEGTTVKVPDHSEGTRYLDIT